MMEKLRLNVVIIASTNKRREKCGGSDKRPGVVWFHCTVLYWIPQVGFHLKGERKYNVK